VSWISGGCPGSSVLDVQDLPRIFFLQDLPRIFFLQDLPRIFAGRVTRQTWHDGRSVGYQYDPAGNLTAITPPGREAHIFKRRQRYLFLLLKRWIPRLVVLLAEN